MPDVTLPSGIIQPAIGSTAWGAKQHANLALMDPLFSRVAAIEAAAPAEYLSLGTTFPQILEAIADITPGTRLYLPNETIEQRVTGTSVLTCNKEFELFGHPGGLSELYLDGNVTSGYGGGTSHQIQIGKDSATVIPRMRLSGFKITHDRAVSPDMRCSAIDLGYPCNNLEIDHITFEGLSSDFFLGRPYPWSTKWGCIGLSIHHCTGVEMWEGFFNWHSGWLYDGHVHNNQMAASNQHAGYQGPMMIELNIEQTVGGIEKFYAWGNTGILTGAALIAGGTIGYVHNASPSTGHVYYHDIHVSDNIFNGFYFGGFFSGMNETRGALPAQKTLTVITKNQFLNSAVPIYVWPNSIEWSSAKIVSNRCVRGATSSGHGWLTQYAHDQEVYAKVTNINQFVLYLGLQNVLYCNDISYYVFFSNTTTAEIWKVYDQGLGPKYLQLGASIAITHAPDDQWKFRRVGSTLTLYKNGSLVDTRTDSDVTGPGYIGFVMYDAATSMIDFGGGNVGSSALLDSCVRANEDPINPTNWIASGGWRSASANDKMVFIDNTGNTNLPNFDQTQLGINGPIEIVQSPNPNAWT